MQPQQVQVQNMQGHPSQQPVTAILQSPVQNKEQFPTVQATLVSNSQMIPPQQMMPIQNMFLGGDYMGRFPRSGVCPHCRSQVTTGTRLAVSGGTWGAAAGIFIFSGGLCCPCMFFPLCMDDCKEVVHECPACGKVVGTQKFLF